MQWIIQLCVAIWAVTNDLAWYASDPAAKHALVQANCTVPTPGCIRQAKAIYHQLIKEHDDFYWCGVREEAAKLEHERQTKEAHDRYIAEQLAKGDKWDRWEVSPPTVIVNNINNFISPTVMVSPTFVSVCTAPPEVPGIDAKALAARNRARSESKVSVEDWPSKMGAIQQTLLTVAMIVIIVIIIVMLFKGIWRLYNNLVGASPDVPPPPPSSSSSSSSSSAPPPSPPPPSPPPSPKAPERPLEASKGTSPPPPSPPASASPSQRGVGWETLRANLEEEMEESLIIKTPERPLEGDADWDTFAVNPDNVVVEEEMVESFANKTPERPLESTSGTQASEQLRDEAVAAPLTVVEEVKTSTGSAGDPFPLQKKAELPKRWHRQQAALKAAAEEAAKAEGGAESH
ncbi:hypothetical protein OPT61_g7873 [Boeremia exigua]|uniref:Uncharacterized protein n=1 Tax=Boeremia exigua TaxID=749465 RepID=A0ACC2I0S5_9PLEO|nr:hypothetical protein OPT61_g7873 [Boeremia exigua]